MRQTAPRNIAVVIGSGLLFSIVAGVFAGFTSAKSTTYVISPVLGPYLDFWDSPKDECFGVDRVIAMVNAARRTGHEPDLSIVDRLPGHRTIRAGTRVRMLAQQTISCDGSSERFARILVTDPRSHLVRRQGYVTASRITPL